MSTLGELKSQTDFYLGAQFIYKADDKKVAANVARKQLLLNYDIEEFIITGDLTFTSGVASKPSLYLRHVKLFDEDDPDPPMTKLDVNDFDKAVENTWSIKFVESSSDYRIHINPTDITTRKFRYVKLPADMSDDSDESGFNSYWLDAHACWSAWVLLFNDRQAVAGEKKAEAIELVQTALRHQAADEDDQPALTTQFDNIGPLVNTEEG